MKLETCHEVWKITKYEKIYQFQKQVQNTEKQQHHIYWALTLAPTKNEPPKCS